MKKMRLIGMTLMFACILGMAGLVACSGGSTSSAASGSEGASSAAASESAALSDEEIIKADAQTVLDSLITKEVLVEAMKNDESFAAFQSMGLDLDEFAEKLTGVFKFSVGDVTVNGDTATAAVTMTLPDFSADTDELLNKAMTEVTDGVDVEGMSEKEQVSLIMDVMMKVMTDPDMPTTSSDFDLKYTKDNGTWKVDEEGLDVESLSEISKIVPQA